MFVITCTSNHPGSILEGKTFLLHKNGRQPSMNLRTDPPKLLVREKTALRFVNEHLTGQWPGWTFDIRPATAREVAASTHHKATGPNNPDGSKRRTPYILGKSRQPHRT